VRLRPPLAQRKQQAMSHLTSPPTGTPTAAPALVLEGVSKKFGGLTAVSNVSFSLASGSRLAVIGPNGAGKTTLFRLIAGEMRTTSGTVQLFGKDATSVGERQRALLGVSRTFQVSNLFPTLSVLDNVRMAAQVASSSSRQFWRRLNPRDSYGARAEDVLGKVGLADRVAQHVSNLSHGEQRQLEIAMALVSEPKLILLDEPAAGLSAAERVILRDLLGQLPRSISFLLIEHDMTLALELVDNVLCLDNGVQLAYGTPDEIRANDAVQDVYLGRRKP
jgi:branched-chain amino acid transport system ATP-binding protein